MLTTLAIPFLLALPQHPGEVTPCAECKPLTEPPCSYVITQHAKGLVALEDPVIAWIRARHNGGAAPLRHFLAGPRVVNDTYGLFFYDPDGGYVAAYEKAYGYAFHGWRRGVMVVKHEDGTLFSALTGLGFAGPRTGQRLPRIPSLTTTWGHWLALHPESTAYDLFDGKRYPVVELPKAPDPASTASRGTVDARLPADAPVLGVFANGVSMAFPLAGAAERAVLQDKVGGTSVVVFVNGAARAATAFRAVRADVRLEFAVDAIAPVTAPFKDKNTNTRWSVAGRGIDGLLRGEELVWVDSVQCHWFAWVAEHPDTLVHEAAPPPAEGGAKK
jgi:hypothetical protein